jgi:hypothetical protein
VRFLLAVPRSQSIDLRLQRCLVGFQAINFRLHHRDALELHAQLDAILFDLLTLALMRYSHPVPRLFDLRQFTLHLAHPLGEPFELCAGNGTIRADGLPTYDPQTVAV